MTLSPRASARAGTPTGDVLINEFLAENLSGLKDESGSAEDWIELRNRSSVAVPLGGWSLTDDPAAPDKWVFPAVSIPPGGYLVVFASGKDLKATTAGSRLHTNFKLNLHGDYLGLFRPGNPRTEADSLKPRYPEQRLDYSYGRDPSGAWRYYAAPTPGKANTYSVLSQLVAPVEFSVRRGFFNQPVTLSLATATPDATIRYTFDGSPPSATNGWAYSAPLTITTTRIVRAAAFKPNCLPSRVSTHSYLYGLPTNRLLLPALSLTTATNNLFGTNGIMETRPRNTTKRGIAWERPVSAEFIQEADDGGFQVDCGLRVQGGDYVRQRYDPKGTAPFNKYSFRLYFRGAYGPGRLEYPLLGDLPVESFDQISLRAGMNDSSNPFLRDELVRRLYANTGQVSAHGTFVNLFLNGVYKGYYNPAERIGPDFLQTWHGGSNQWDLIAQAGEIRSGDAIAWNSLRSFVTGKNLTVATNYQEVARRLDLTNFVDYLLVNIYSANSDWPHNNWRAARERVPGARFRFYVWDAEWALGYSHPVSWNTLVNELTGGSEISQFYTKLKANPEFRLLFADRAHLHLNNGGALVESRVLAQYLQLTNLVAASITGFDNSIGRVWIPQRRAYMLKHLAAAGLWLSSNAPVFSAFGGHVPRGFALTLSATNGSIYYTTNGTDPRVPFTGAVSPQARLHTSGKTLTLRGTVPLLARTRQGTNWSALTAATFHAEASPPLRFSEIMVRPVEGPAGEFLELLNTGSVPVDLSGMSLEGVRFTFPVGSPPLPAGGRLVLISDVNPALFAQRHPGVAVAGQFHGRLLNGGQPLVLKDADGRVLISLDYQDQRAWPLAANNTRGSLELVDLSIDQDDPGHWRASASLAGSPGTASAVTRTPTVLLNEVLAHNAFSTPSPTGRFADWIELYNPGANLLDLGGYSLSIDRLEAGQWRVPAQTRIPAKGYLLLWCDGSRPASIRLEDPLNVGRSLDTSGGQVYLFNPSGQIQDALAYGFQLPDLSVGRYAGSWQLLRVPTPAAPNAAPIQLGPVTSIRINEWSANTPGQDDWFELYNPSLLPVNLAGLYLTDQPSLGGRTNLQVGPLTFVGGNGWVKWIADGELAKGPNHAPFKLDAQGETLRLYHTNFAIIDSIDFALQPEAVSSGRFPDGDPQIAEFSSPTPGASNNLSHPAPPWSPPELRLVRAPSPVRLEVLHPPAGAALILQFSADLIEWTSVKTNPPSLTEFIDDTADGLAPRFYRLLVQP